MYETIEPWECQRACLSQRCAFPGKPEEETKQLQTTRLTRSHSTRKTRGDTKSEENKQLQLLIEENKQFQLQLLLENRTNKQEEIDTDRDSVLDFYKTDEQTVLNEHVTPECPHCVAGSGKKAGHVGTHKTTCHSNQAETTAGA